jgi:hypothetical protein
VLLSAGAEPNAKSVPRKGAPFYNASGGKSIVRVPEGCGRAPRVNGRASGVKLDGAFGWSHECVDRTNGSTLMQLETKYLRLRTAVTLGSRFGNWRVCWLGGWSRHRLFYLVMLVRVEP